MSDLSSNQCAHVLTEIGNGYSHCAKCDGHFFKVEERYGAAKAAAIDPGASMALAVSRYIHNACKDVPHDIGLRVMEIIGGELFELAKHTSEPPEPAHSADHLQRFTDWLVKEMPAGTVIGDPAWWARKLLAGACVFADELPPGIPTPDLLTRMRSVYDRIQCFPESTPEGVMALITMRGLVGELLGDTSTKSEPTCDDGLRAKECPTCHGLAVDVTQDGIEVDCTTCGGEGFVVRAATETSVATESWRCTVCNLNNPADATHCRQCEYSRMVLRDGQEVPRNHHG